MSIENFVRISLEHIMQVDNVLILAAGKGTRMGNIGKKLPKVIWPIFKKSILELEVLYAKEFNPSNIFINIYNYKKEITEHIKKSDVFSNVNIIEESESLDIGGAIHNIASKLNYTGILMVMNSDQFILLTEELKSKMIKLLGCSDCVILTHDVTKADGYNAIDSKDGRVVGIIENSLIGNNHFETYTGMSLINLKSLKPQDGESKFFESVANFHTQKILKINIKESEYWDFGTLRRYSVSMFKIIEKIKNKNLDSFCTFLINNSAIDVKNIGDQSYCSNKKRVIDLGRNSNHIENTIYLDTSSILPSVEACIVGKNREDLLS